MNTLKQGGFNKIFDKIKLLKDKCVFENNYVPSSTSTEERGNEGVIVELIESIISPDNFKS